MGKYEGFFNEIASQLDLTATEETTIIQSYEAVGEFLSNSEYLSRYNPRVFPQGSMRIGTTVKPLKRNDYDIDLVCELTENFTNLSPREVKQLVGNALKNGRYGPQLDKEHGRCWTLQYKASPPYHLDILPGITKAGERINATKRDSLGRYDWLSTNPKGFANWFLNLYKHTKIFDERFEVEKVKTYGNRTPLQRAAQLIKRHRDVYFQNRVEDGPASIIITTLLGLSYNGETTIEEILRNCPITWASFIKCSNNKYYIKVPSLTDDNYADKWNGEDISGPKLFFEWHAKLIADLDRLFAQTDFNSFLKVAKQMFNESIIDSVINESVSIKDSLSSSFKRQLPMVTENAHPLFKHALSIKSDNHEYIPRGDIQIRIKGKVFRTEDDRNKNIDANCIETFNSYSSLLQKNLYLRFYCVISNCFSKCYLRWQITNTGQEALAGGKENLRGGFEFSELGVNWTKYECTSYSGSHFVQAFLIDKSTGNCIAKSNILTVNIGG